MVLLIPSCGKMQVTSYTSHDFIFETLYIVAYYRLYAFLLDFLMNFSPKCLEWKPNCIPLKTVHLHILNVLCSGVIAFHDFQNVVSFQLQMCDMIWQPELTGSMFLFVFFLMFPGSLT